MTTTTNKTTATESDSVRPDDPRLRTLSVRPHDLADYDRLHDESDSADEEQSRDDDNEQDNSD